MSKRGSWFSGFLGQPTDGTNNDAKERAAKITREADIRRLYEAGTQQDVLEQLYQPEEVAACIQKCEEEKKMLALLDGSEEKSSESAPSSKEKKATTTIEEDQQGATTTSSTLQQIVSTTDEKEGGGAEQDNGGNNSKGKEDSTDATTTKRKTNFTTLRLGSRSGGDLDESILSHTPGDRAVDTSLELGMMDSVHINENSTRSHTGVGGAGRGNSNALGGLDDESSDDEQVVEPENDLLKELLNPDLDGSSSQYIDESVTSHDDDFHQGTTTSTTAAVTTQIPGTSSTLGQKEGSGGSSQEGQGSGNNNVGKVNNNMSAEVLSQQGGITEVKNQVNKADNEDTIQAESPRGEDSSEDGKDDAEETSMNTEEPMVTTEEVEVEVEETMDDELEELVAPDEGEGGDAMNYQEENQMETTSVEDDEELSQEIVEQGKRIEGDEEMNDTVASLSSVVMDPGELHSILDSY